MAKLRQNALVKLPKYPYSFFLMVEVYLVGLTNGEASGSVQSHLAVVSSQIGAKTMILEVPGVGRLDSGPNFFRIALLMPPHQRVPPSFWIFIPYENLCQNACILLTFHWLFSELGFFADILHTVTKWHY